MNIKGNDIKRFGERLKRHFRRERQLQRMLERRTGLKELIDKLNNNIQECNYNIENPIGAIRYDKERVQTSGISNQIEDALMKAHDDIVKELTEAQIEQAKVESTCIRMGIEVEELNDVINFVLDDEQKECLLMYYKEGCSYRHIGKTKGYEHSVARKRMNKAVECIIQEVHITDTNLPQYNHQIEESIS